MGWFLTQARKLKSGDVFLTAPSRVSRVLRVSRRPGSSYYVVWYVDDIGRIARSSIYVTDDISILRSA